MRTNYLRAFMALLATAVLGAYGSASAQGSDPSPISPYEVKVIDVSPNPGAKNVSRSAPDISVAFDTNMDPTTINKRTLKLRKKANHKTVLTDVEYDSGSSTATLQPIDSAAFPKSLAASTSYKVQVFAGSSGVRSVDGGKLGGVTEEGAKFKNGNVHWPFTTGAAT